MARAPLLPTSGAYWVPALTEIKRGKAISYENVFGEAEGGETHLVREMALEYHVDEHFRVLDIEHTNTSRESTHPVA